jgi:hypothetical protein
LVSLPIGSIIGYYQYKTTNANGQETWLPQAPFGFYALGATAKEINLNYLNPDSVSYNYLLRNAFKSW